MEKLWKWLKREFREIYPVWAFFLISFGLIVLTLSSILGEFHVELSQPPEYIGGSFIMAKAVVIIDGFFKKQWLRNRPLVYAVVFNAILYFLGGFILRHAERLFKLMWRQHLPFLEANRQVFSGMRQPQYWAIITWVIVVILAFSLIREVIKCIGRDRFIEMFFKRPVSANENIRKAS